jgi:hypothetical protein
VNRARLAASWTCIGDRVNAFLLATPPLVAAGAAGSWMLRRAWIDRGETHRALVAGGWGLFLVTILIACFALGPVLGIAATLALAPLGVGGVILAGAQRKAARPARDRASLAPEPLEGPSRAWRGWLKALLAGPLGMTAAMGLSFCYAVWAPGAVQTRLLIAALLVPALWGLAMTWTLADQRLLRATAVLVGTSVLGFGLAFLGGIA